MTTSKQLLLDFPIVDEFSFDNFVVHSNAELVSALQADFLRQQAFVFIWGKVGTGKTHLLQAACHLHQPGAYMPLRKFAGRSPDSLESLESLELVCLDDLEAVLGKRDWEERLFMLFNNVREQGGRLLISASQSPRGLKFALPDLASRLGWGVVYHLQELDDQGKAEALRLRAAGRGFALNDEVLNFILLRSTRHMHSLFEVLDRMDHLSLQEKRRITVPFVKQVMQW
ncbi:MAG: DnaA regulatory inactivator Hda [Pseudohongiellaceae bacterium]